MSPTQSSADPSAPLLRVTDLSVTFVDFGRRLLAVQHLSFDIRSGEIVALVGESGCGKTLTARALLRLVPDQALLSGSLFFEGRDLVQLSEAEMRAIRGLRLSMIFQEPMTALNPVLTVGDQASEVLTSHLHLTPSEAHERVVDMFARVGLPDPATRAESYPHQLSGGMRQRVMIAMALLGDPSLLVADEPTTALDATIRQQILSLLLTESLSRAMAVLFITHDLELVRNLADSVGVMYAGHLVEWASSQELFAHPRHPYTRGLLASSPTFCGGERPRLTTIPGAVPRLGHLGPGCPFAARCAEVTPRCQEEVPPWRGAPDHRLRCFLG